MLTLTSAGPLGQVALPAADDPLNGVLKLVQGRVDALALVSAAEAPLVQYLLHTPGARLLGLAQAEGHARRFPFLRAAGAAAAPAETDQPAAS